MLFKARLYSVFVNNSSAYRLFPKGTTAVVRVEPPVINKIYLPGLAEHLFESLYKWEGRCSLNMKSQVFIENVTWRILQA